VFSFTTEFPDQYMIIEEEQKWKVFEEIITPSRLKR
jgi:hypothetical protein